MSKTFELVGQNSKLELHRLETEPFGTNAYIAICRETGQGVLFDAPGETETIAVRLEQTAVKYILITHGHVDHIIALEAIVDKLKTPLAAHRDDSGMLPVSPDQMLNGGELIKCGNLSLEVIHTPGHTAGSICFRLENYLISGDTIFPGGPGKTASADDFKTIVTSINEKVLTLPDETVILPGHGASTTVKTERELFNKFRSLRHDEQLYGDVTWL